MKIRIVMLLLAVFVVMSGYCFGGAPDSDTGLHVYLPREVILSGDTISLGNVVVLRGDESMTAKARDIGLGKFAVATQQIVIDRQTLLSRLASNNIMGSQVTMSGAEEVVISRQSEKIAADRLVNVARSFLMSQDIGILADEISLVRKPGDMVLPDDSTGQVKLVARNDKYFREGRAGIWVRAVCDGVEVAEKKLEFHLKYLNRKAVAVKDIEKGSVLSPENVKIEIFQATTPESNDWMSPYGLKAKNKIRKGNVINKAKVFQVDHGVFVKKKQRVIVKIERFGLYVSSIGEALTEGRGDDYIRVRVRSVNSETRIITGKINSDGSVSPVL